MRRVGTMQDKEELPFFSSGKEQQQSSLLSKYGGLNQAISISLVRGRGQSGQTVA